MSTTLINNVNDSTGTKSDRVTTESNFINSSAAFCIFGKMCHNRFCMTDILKINLRKCMKTNLSAELILCNACYQQLCRQYEIFASRVKGLRSEFFEQWLAVKIAAVLNNMKTEIDNDGCKCGRTDCNIENLSVVERAEIDRQFIGLMAAFAFRFIPTDTSLLR